MKRLVLTALALLSFQAAANNFSGAKVINLVTAEGERLAIGRVQFSAEGDSQRFAVALDDAPFGNYFLAMRPFKCTAHPVQHVCHFPYRMTGAITAGDLTELEYALLFMHKKPQEVARRPGITSRFSTRQTTPAARQSHVWEIQAAFASSPAP